MPHLAPLVLRSALVLAIASPTYAVPTTAAALSSGSQASASASAPTCQGRPATLVGDGVTRVTGTSGDDVVVSNGSSVKAGDGDDVVCLTGGGRQYALGDRGDDTIAVEMTRYQKVRMFPGPGDDTLRGGPGTDEAWLGDGDDSAVMGAGSDRVTVTERSRITRGPVGGAGRDALVVLPAAYGTATGSDTRVLVDVEQGLVVRDAVTLAEGVRGFEDYSFADRSSGVVRGITTFVGSDRAEYVHAAALVNVEVRVAGGDDVVRVRCGRVSAGSGRDRLVVVGRRCGGAQLWGGPGDDTLVGGPGRDRLSGDAGRDRADGRAGRDRCRAEVSVRCEP